MWPSFQDGFIESSCWSPHAVWVVSCWNPLRLSRCTLFTFILFWNAYHLASDWMNLWICITRDTNTCLFCIYRCIHYVFLTPRRLKIHTHKATNHIWLVKVIHLVVSQKRVCEATGPVPAAMARGTSIRSEREPMQVLKLTWGITRCMGLLCLPLMKQVKCDCKKTGGWEERLGPTFGGC